MQLVAGSNVCRAWQAGTVVLIASLWVQPARAGCDHPAGSWSAFALPWGAKERLALPSFGNDAEAAKAHRSAKPAKKPARETPPPCIRCGDGIPFAPPGGPVLLEQQQALAGLPSLPDPARPDHVGRNRDLPYSLQLIDRIERPPRDC